MPVKYARRQQVKGKFAVIVDYRMSCIASALEPDDDVRLLCQHVRDLSFSLVAPVGAHDRSYHLFVVLLVQMN